MSIEPINSILAGSKLKSTYLINQIKYDVVQNSIKKPGTAYTNFFNKQADLIR
jgi:hypothetical protein